MISALPRMKRYPYYESAKDRNMDQIPSNVNVCNYDEWANPEKTETVMRLGGMASSRVEALISAFTTSNPCRTMLSRTCVRNTLADGASHLKATNCYRLFSRALLCDIIVSTFGKPQFLSPRSTRGHAPNGCKQ